MREARKPDPPVTQIVLLDLSLVSLLFGDVVVDGDVVEAMVVRLVRC